MTKIKKEFDVGKCLELALEGERLCKSYEFDKGITQFKAALECGTNDKRVLSAIFSQLGNAYFYKKDYQKALRYHDFDLKLSQSDEDLVGQSKACGNLGNTYKMLEKFDEAIFYCSKHLDIARLLKDQVGESRALYNLGNVYHTKGKTMAINSNRNLIDFPVEIKECLLKAIEYYKLNLELTKLAGDRDAQGRACGNIGNTYYLLGEFQKAIEVHNERLQIAKECNDKEAERRANCNLGNAHIFCGEFEKSIDNYKQSLLISQEIGNPILEAQAYFSIGNAYFLLKDYKSAIEYYLKHLKFAQLLEDKLGQSRACWSLGNAYNELGDTEGALRFANYHLQLAKETNDKASEEIANKSVIDLKRKLLDENTNYRRTNLSDISNISSIYNKSQIEIEHNLKVKDGIDYFQRKQQQISNSTSKLIEVVNESEFFNKNNLKRNINYLNQLNQQQQTSVKVCNSRPISEINIHKFSNKSIEKTGVLNNYQTPVKSDRKRFQSRQSMENMEIMKLTPSNNTINEKIKKSTNQVSTDQIDSNKKSYCSSSIIQTSNNISTSSSSFVNRDLDDQFLDFLANFQSKRMDDQRCPLDLIIDNKENHQPDYKQQNKSRKTNLNRSISTAYSGNQKKEIVSNLEIKSPNTKEMKRRNSNPSFTESTSTITSANTQECRDELFDLIEGIQGKRMDDQRALLPSLRRSQTTQETIPKTSTSSSIDSQQHKDHPKNLHRMSTTVDQLTNDQIKHNRQMSFSTDIQPDDDFFDMLMKVQSSRIEDQRSTLPTFHEAVNNNNNEEVINQNLINNQHASNNQSHQPQSNQSTQNDEELLDLQSLLIRLQAGRLEDQRSTLPKEEQDLINLNSSGSHCSSSNVIGDQKNRKENKNAQKH